MNTLLPRKSSTLGFLKSLLFASTLIFSLATLNGCGGSADQTLPSNKANTPLSVTNFTGLTGYTLGSAQTYSVTIKDPDGIASVTANLDGVNVPVTNVGDIYSITVPTSLTVGTHSVIFSARGKSSDGTLEVPVSEGINFTVFVNNTPLTMSAVQGFAAYTIGTAQTYYTDVVDPNGITNVTATLNGQTIAVTNTTGRYSVVVPANTAAGNNTVRFDAIGKQPSGASESVTSAQIAFVIYPNNTQLLSGNIVGLTSYTTGGTQTYSLSPVDPDGIASVTATLDGAAVTLSANGNTYSFSTPTNLTVGSHAVSFTATGKLPTGVSETPVTISQSISVLANNTPLNIGAILGATSYIVGNVQQYTTIVTDPDGISSVTATLDGNAITVAPSGSSYSITLPVSVVAGPHTVQFTAIGKRPDSTLETAQSVTLPIQVLSANTLLTMSNISGPTAFQVASAPVFSINIVDPDGINNVAATLDGQTIGFSISGPTYSVTVPSVLSVGQHTLVFTARGTVPGGGLEATQTRSVTFTVQPPNTALTISVVNGPATIALNTIGTYSITVSDPDGIKDVSATIDGVAANVTNNLGVYSVQTPAYSTAGQHSVTFTAIGQLPDATPEVPQFASFGFSAQATNTPITITNFTGPSIISIGQGGTFSATVVDPDGIVSVTATINGQSIPAAQNGSSYSVQVPALTVGGYTVIFTAVGKVGLGPATESTQTAQLAFTVTQANNPVVFGSFFTQIAGLGAGVITQYSIEITDVEGVDSVTAVDSNGMTLPVTISQTPTTALNTTYSAQAYSGSLQNGGSVSVSYVRFTAIGKRPDGSLQPAQSIQVTGI
jgi:hypothetical protein